MACIEAQDTGKSSAMLKSKDLATCCFQKKFDTHPLKLSPASERSTYPLQY